jgi:hypothetical protein
MIILLFHHAELGRLASVVKWPPPGLILYLTEQCVTYMAFWVREFQHVSHDVKCKVLVQQILTTG